MWQTRVRRHLQRIWLRVRWSSLTWRSVGLGALCGVIVFTVYLSSTKSRSSAGGSVANRNCRDYSPPHDLDELRRKQNTSEGSHLDFRTYVLDRAAFAGDTSFSVREQAFATACSGTELGSSPLWSLGEQKDLCQSCMLMANYFMEPHYSRRAGDWGTATSEAFLGRRDHCDPSDPECSMRTYYNSAHKSNCCVTVLHDGAISDSFISEHRTRRFRFVKVNVTKHDSIFGRKFGLNDARFFNIHEVFCTFKELRKVFFTDIFDVRVVSSPCLAAEPGFLYVGQDFHNISNEWLGRRFTWMGGQYLQFYKDTILTRIDIPMWSAGIIGGGDRQTLSEFWNRLLAVLTDPTFIEVHRRHGRSFQGVNMGAVNYVVEYFFKERTKGGSPLHSKYRQFECDRADVWFNHK